MTPRQHSISAVSWSVLALVLFVLAMRVSLTWSHGLGVLPCVGFGFSMQKAFFHYVRIPRPPR